MDMTQLYQAHISHKLAKIDRILEHLNLAGLVVGAGEATVYFEDDQGVLFHTYHHFSALCPAAGERHLLVIQRGKKPQLYYYAPKDFWFENKPLAASFWTSSFDVEEIGDDDTLWARVKDLASTAYIGPNSQKAEANGLIVATEELKHRLNWEKSYKTAYEVRCVEEATKYAAAGHQAAKTAFDQGGSELDIHLAYLKGARLSGADLPFGAIVGLNEKGAVLHYEHKRDDFRNGAVLLIDTGVAYYGYAADITRTYANERAPREFRDLVTAMNELQQEICRSVRPGVSFADLHHGFHMGLATMLKEHRLVNNLSAEEVVSAGISRAFCPHGLGHMLGTFVHDVAGKQKDEKGTPCDPDPRYPNLRTTRVIEKGFLFTIEPGLYFIRMLLDPFRNDAHHARNLNWSLIDQLAPFGGIRIEDDLYVEEHAVRNLTRPYLP